MRRIFIILISLFLVGCNSNEVIELKTQNHEFKTEIEKLDSLNQNLYEENEKLLSEISEKNERIDKQDLSLKEAEDCSNQVESLMLQIEVHNDREATYVDALNSYRTQYRKIIEEWEGLTKEQKIIEGYSNTLVSLLHMQPDEEYVFFSKKRILRIAPLDTSPKVAEVSEGTLSKVFEMNNVHHNNESGLWYYVSIPNYAEPMNTRGWIRKEEIIGFSDIEIEEVKNVGIMSGSLIYHVWEYKNINNAEGTKEDYRRHGWIEDERDGYVLLTLPGGDFGWTMKDNIIVPESINEQ